MSQEQTPQSWILDLRARLAQDEHFAEEDSGPAIAVFVPLFVGDRGLSTVVIIGEPVAPEGLRRVRLPSAEVAGSGQLWSAVAELASEELGVEPRTVLRLGRLAPLHLGDRYGVADLPLLPCVGAVPRFTPAAGLEAELVTVPLSALSAPHGVETARVDLTSEVIEVAVRQIGSLLLWGPAADVLDELLVHLRPAH